MRLPILIGCGLIAATLLISLIGWGEGSPEEAAMKESISFVNEMAAILETAKDAKTAHEAEAKLKRFGPRGEALAKKNKALPKEQVEVLAKKYEVEFKAAHERFAKALMKAMTAGYKIDPKLLEGP